MIAGDGLTGPQAVIVGILLLPGLILAPGGLIALIAALVTEDEDALKWLNRLFFFAAAGILAALIIIAIDLAVGGW